MDPIGIANGGLALLRTVFGVVGIFVRKLDLTFQPDQPPFLHTTPIFLALPQTDAEGNPLSIPTTGRMYMVGLKNRTLSTVDDVRVELVSMEPRVIGHLPLPLAVMHGDKQPLTVHRASEPTYFVSVVAKVDTKDVVEIQHTVTGVSREIPLGRYRVGIRATGRNTKPTSEDFIIDVDNEKRLLFSKE